MSNHFRTICIKWLTTWTKYSEYPILEKVLIIQRFRGTIWPYSYAYSEPCQISTFLQKQLTVKHFFKKVPSKIFGRFLNTSLTFTLRSNHRRCSVKIVLRTFAKFTGKHLCQSLFFNKVAGCHIKKDSSTGVFL